jgi:dihydrolipoamide dehydrogenase
VRIVIIGGGPAGYDAAQVAAELGAEVTLVERLGMGGACVLWDCVPSKTLCSTAEVATWLEAAPTLGLTASQPPIEVNLATIFGRILMLAAAQSADIRKRTEETGVRLLDGTARFVDPATIEVAGEGGALQQIEADAFLIATGSSPRVLQTAVPDGRRILNGRQVYDLADVPERLIVVGSGATGAEFAHAFNRLGSHITLVSSRDRVLPHEDPDAARVLEDVFTRRGMTILKDARAARVEATEDGVVVTLTDGATIDGTHALMTIGQVPNSAELGLEAAGVLTGGGGEIPIDGVSRTNVRHIYAAGDVTGGVMLASVASMQARIAMWHALGQEVEPLRPDAIAATVFTDPEIATVGTSEEAARASGRRVRVYTLPYATNARAKMVGLEDGFVKIICGADSRVVIGATVVAPHASDLILPLSVAVHARLHVSEVARAYSIYPSFGGSITEAARRLMAD